MDTLDKLTRLTTSLTSKKDKDKSAAFKKIVNLLVSGTSWSVVAKELSTLSKSQLTAEKFGLADDEFADLKGKANDSEGTNFALSAFQKSMCKKLDLVLKEVEKDAKENRFEDVILPLLVLSADLPLKYFSEIDPVGTRINYAANDRMNKDKSFLYAPEGYKSLGLTPSSSNPITRPFIIPILQFVIKSDRYIVSERMRDFPFIAQCLRFAVHFEDAELKMLRSSVWEFAVKVMKAMDLMWNPESVAIFDQLNVLIWHDNGEKCTQAVWAGPFTKSLVMSREEVYACIAILRAIDKGVSINAHLKSCLRDVVKTVMKSVSYRKSSDDLLALLKQLDIWSRKGKDGPLGVQLVRMMIRDVMEAYDSFLAKSPIESMGKTTKYLLNLVPEALAVTSNLKSVKSSLESLFDRVNSTISKSGRDGGDSMGEYVKFLNDCDDSTIDTKETPWLILFRVVLVRCFVLKMKMEWVEKADLISPLLKKMTGLLKTVSDGLNSNSSCDYMNECIPFLTETVYLLINSKMENTMKWECMVGLCDADIPSSIIQSISIMKNQSAKNQCSALISKMVIPLTLIVNSHPPKTTLVHFESFFTLALTIDLPQEIRESVCTMWKNWYGSRMDQLSGTVMSDGLKDRLKWFNLPIPPHTISEKLEVKLEVNEGSKNHPSSLLKRDKSFSSPAPIKKTKNANDALKMIDLMDEDSVQFFPVEESPKKKQRMTEKQKEMMTEKKDRLPFMEDESRTGMAKIPADIFEMSMSGVDGSSKGSGSRRGPMKTDFSHLNTEKKSDGKDIATGCKKNGEEEKETEKTQKKIDIRDDNIEQSSTESLDEESGGEDRKGGRRKAKTPKKIEVKAKEGRSPSRKKLDAAMSVDSPKRKSRRLGKIEENGKKEEEKVDENEKKQEEKKEEASVEMMEVKGMEETTMSEIASEEKKTSTPKRSNKITLSVENSQKDEEMANEAQPAESSSIPLFEESPFKAVKGEPDVPDVPDVPVPCTPVNRGTFEPVGILSSAKKHKSEASIKKKGGVHFEEKIAERSDEEKEEEKKKKEEEEEEEGEAGKGVVDKMVFPLLRDNEDSIDTITLKLGLNSRMVKRSLEKIGVKTVGQLAAMTAKEINALMGIKPPTMVTVKSVLEGVWTRSQKSGSKPLPPICTPEKKEEDTVASPKGSPITRRISPSKSKSRKRLALSDSPVRVKRSKEEKENESVEGIEENGNEKEADESMEESIEMEVIEDKKEEVAMKEIVIEEKSDVVEKKEDRRQKEDRCDPVMVIDEEKENKENEVIETKEEEDMKKEGEEKKPAIASVQDVLSFIDGLKGGSLQSLLTAHDQITLSLLEAIREARNSQPTN